MTDTLVTRLGVVRRSSDGWGFGLYDESLAHRYWFRTRVDPASRSGEDPRSIQADGLPVVEESTLVWVGLNPSWSDDKPKANRVSLMKVLNWAGQRGLTEVVGVNLFAYRHTDVDGLKAHVSASDLLNSVGEHNDAILAHVFGGPGLVLAAWGGDGATLTRGSAVRKLMGAALCPGVCANGEPKHPARLANATALVPLPELA